MKLVGLTGGVGMGKSTAGELIKKSGVSIIDTDNIARQLVEPGQPLLLEIQKKFGPQILDADGRLRRDELARRVFADSQARKELEAILHPPIRQTWQAETQQWREQGCALGVVIIPLLFETDAGGLFDATVCVACSAATQAQRLHERGWNNVQIKQRLEAQWPVEKKMLLSKFVIWTDTTLEAHSAQWQHILNKIAKS